MQMVHSTQLESPMVCAWFRVGIAALSIEKELEKSLLNLLYLLCREKNAPQSQNSPAGLFGLRDSRKITRTFLPKVRRPGWAHIRSFFCTLSHPFSAGSPGQGWGLVKVCTKVQAAAVCTKSAAGRRLHESADGGLSSRGRRGICCHFPLKKKLITHRV